MAQPNEEAEDCGCGQGDRCCLHGLEDGQPAGVGLLATGNWIMLLSRLKDAGFDVNMTAEDLAALRSPALLAEFERIAEHLDERGLLMAEIKHMDDSVDVSKTSEPIAVVAEQFFEQVLAGDDVPDDIRSLAQDFFWAGAAAVYGLIFASTSNGRAQDVMRMLATVSMELASHGMQLQVVPGPTSEAQPAPGAKPRPVES